MSGKWGEVIGGGNPATLFGISSLSILAGREGTRETPKNSKQEGYILWRLKDDSLAKEHCLEACSGGVQDAQCLRGEKGASPGCQTVSKERSSFLLEAAA